MLDWGLLKLMSIFVLSLMCDSLQKQFTVKLFYYICILVQLRAILPLKLTLKT